MASSDKNRLSVFLVFILLLIGFGIFYRPTNAESRPTVQNFSASKQVEVLSQTNAPTSPDKHPTAHKGAVPRRLTTRDAQAEATLRKQ